MGMITDIKDLSPDEYGSFLGENVAENLSREYYNGVASCDEYEYPTGAIVWQLSNVDSLEGVESELVFLNAEDGEMAGELLEEYQEKVSEDEIKKTFFELPDISEEMVAVLKEYGFSIEEREGRDIFATVGDVASNRMIMPKKPPKNILPLSDLELLQFRQGITNCLFAGVTGLYEDLALLPKEWYEEDVSCAYMDDDKAVGFFLVHLLPNGALMPVLLYASGVDSRKNILDLMRYSVWAAARKYEDIVSIVIKRHDDKTRKLSAYLFPGVKGEQVIAGEREEA